MVVSKSGDGLTVEVGNGVMIWEFLDGMELSAFCDEAYLVYEELLKAHDVDATVPTSRWMIHSMPIHSRSGSSQRKRRIEQGGVGGQLSPTVSSRSRWAGRSTVANRKRSPLKTEPRRLNGLKLHRSIQ